MCVGGNTPCLSCRPPSFANGTLPFEDVDPSCSNLVVGEFDSKDAVGVRSVNTQTASLDGIVLDAPAASCAAEFVRPPSSNGCMKSSSNSFASSSPAPFLAAGVDSRLMDNDSKSPN